MPVAAADLKTCEIVVPGVASAEGSDPQNCVNVFHFRRTAFVSPVNKDAVATQFAATVLPALVACLNVTYNVQELHVRMLEDVTDPYLVHDLGPGGVPGTVTGDRLNAKNAAFLLLKTAYRGRSYRGSKHLGPMSESHCTAGSAELWNAGALTLLHSLGSTLLAGFTDATPNHWVPVLWSRKLSDMVVVPADIAAFDLAQVLVNKRVGSMRSRNVKTVY